MRTFWCSSTRVQNTFLALGAITFVYSLVMSFFVNFNAGLLLLFMVGVYLFVVGAFYKKIKSYTLSRVCLGVSVCMLCVGAVLAAAIGIYGNSDNPSYKEDAVIVLGCGIRGEEVSRQLKSRLDAAFKYHKANPRAVIVVSGGQGAGEDITEALAMERYLVEKGVPKNLILKEEKSTSTKTNLVYSKELLDKKLGDGYKTVIITNDYHVYRATRLAQKLGFDYAHVHSNTAWSEAPVRYSRELLAVAKTFLMDL